MLPHQNSPAALESHIKGLYDTTHTAYEDYLEGGDPSCSGQIIEVPELRCMSFSTYETLVIKLARTTGLSSFIKLEDEEFSSRRGIKHIKRAKVTFGVNDGKSKIMDMMEPTPAKMTQEKIYLRAVLWDLLSTDELTSLTAIRADASLREVLETYPHVTEEELNRREWGHEAIQAIHTKDPDFVSKLVVLRSLYTYQFGQFNKAGVLQQPTLDLLKASQAFQPTDEKQATIDSHETAMMSAALYNQMRKQTLENLVRDGYDPLRPEEFMSSVKDFLDWQKA